MHAVVVGGSGQIGGWLVRVLQERGHTAAGTFATQPFAGLELLDAADLENASRWVRGQRPDVVFYPAGFTWVDQCERDPARAFASNVEQPLNLARAADAVGARFVYFSTDYVFDGRNGPYDEAAATNPLSVYGRAKLEAEQALGNGRLTIRTTWVYGPERQGKNFAYQLARTLGAGQHFTCPADQVSTPSYGPDVARAAVLLAEAARCGTYHVAGRERLDRPQFARAIATAFGLAEQYVVARSTAELSQVAARPLNSGLLTPKLDACLPGVMRSLGDCLADFRNRLDEPGNGICPLFQVPA